ncbi:MAG: hypothetical protein NY202_01265 [Mollicutes bacterium UO1]
MIPESLDNSLTRKNYAFFRIKEEYNYLNPLFLVAFLTSDEYQDYFDELSHGTAHKLITTKKFLSIKVSLTEEELKQKNLEFTKQKELELELELATVRQKIKEIIAKK